MGRIEYLIEMAKNKILKLIIQYEEYMDKATTDAKQAQLQEGKDDLEWILNAFNALCDNNRRSTIKCDKLEAYIQDINKDKFNQK